jgi:hypothetical protein
VNTQFGRGTIQPSGNVEIGLATWLRGFDTGPLPVATRLRISADLRAQAIDPHRSWTRLSRLVSTAASVAVVLGWAALILLAVTSLNTASYGPGAPTGPELVVNPPAPDLGSPQWQPDLLGLALIIFAGVLAGAAINLRLVRSTARRMVFGSTEASAAAPIPWRRRLRSVPRLALVLAMIPVINVVMQPYLDHPLMLNYSLSLFMPSALACVVAFRYPLSDRSTRWLLAGGLALGISVAMHLDTYWTLRTIGWLALAVGLAARAGVAYRPPRLLVAAAVGVVLYAEIGQLTITAAMYHPVDYVMPELIYQAITECVISVAMMAIIWTAFTRLCGGGGLVWLLVLAAASGSLGLQLYHALNMNIDFTYWLLPWVDPDTLANALLAAQSLSFALLLAALLIGVRPAITATRFTPGAPVSPISPASSEGTPQRDPDQDQDLDLDVATP